MYTITHEIQQQKAQVIAMNLPSPAIGPQALDPKKPTIPSKMKIAVPMRIIAILIRDLLEGKINGSGFGIWFSIRAYGRGLHWRIIAASM